MKDNKETTREEQVKSEVSKNTSGGQQAATVKNEADKKDAKEGLERDASIKNSK